MSDKTINTCFDELLKQLELTKVQNETMVKRCDFVIKRLRKAYYGANYTGDVKLLIGSFAKGTAIRPLADVDIIFKIPKETFDQFRSYQNNGPADLLQDVRKSLEQTYPLTEKHGWVKVVTLEFETPPRVEILPAYEQADGTFIIPNSANGGRWETYNARNGLLRVTSCDKKTHQLIKLIKHWRNGISADIASYVIENRVLDFAANIDINDWLVTINNFFGRLALDPDSIIASPAKTAKTRIEKAIAFISAKQYQNACDELRKVFVGFPPYDKNSLRITELSRLYPSAEEQYIEDFVDINIRNDIKLGISALASTEDAKWAHGRRPLQAIIEKFHRVPPNFSITFTPKTDYAAPVTYRWKVRNFGEEARNRNKLRGEIRDGDPENGSIVEPTLFTHQYHYVECYMIEGDVCIARSSMFVPIGRSG